MPTKEEIVLAIGTHIWWKNEFENAVADGWHFLNPELAERSQHSELGLWLAELSLAEPDSEHFRTVRALYANFQEATAEVVRLAASGNIDRAETNIRTGFYAQASIALTLALRDWMDSVGETENLHRLNAMQPQPTQPTPIPAPNRQQRGS